MMQAIWNDYVDPDNMSYEVENMSSLFAFILGFLLFRHVSYIHMSDLYSLLYLQIIMIK